MCKRVWWAAVLAAVMALSGAAWGETGHYVPGVEGIKAASLPPPGWYYRQYNVFYNASRLTDGGGNSLPLGFNVSVWANVHRAIWLSDIKILGATYGADVIVPLIQTDLSLRVPNITDKNFGLGDPCIEPLILAWHGSRWDASVAAGVYLPFGEYSMTEPASPGKGFASGLFTFGGTWYADAHRTWSASALGRYEVHSKQRDTGLTPGNDLTIEWGLAKTFIEPSVFWDLGVAGYCHWQTTDDSGPGSNKLNDQVFGIGPEISIFLPRSKLILSLRSVFEFGAVDRSEGNTTTFTVTGMF